MHVHGYIDKLPAFVYSSKNLEVMSSIHNLINSLNKHHKDLTRQCGNNGKDTKPRKFTYDPMTGKRVNSTSTSCRPTKRKAKAQYTISKKCMLVFSNTNRY